MRNPTALINAVLRLFRARSMQGKALALIAILAMLFAGWQSHAPRSYHADKSAAQRGEVILGEVVGVSDGDTVTVLDQAKREFKIRLAYIDAPEKSQPYGMDAKRHLSDLIYRQTVQVMVQDVDRYGRAVGLIHLGERDVNLQQVLAGYAWHYQQFARSQPASDFERYAQAQDGARQARMGLWQAASPTPPWDFRRQKRDGSE